MNAFLPLCRRAMIVLHGTSDVPPAARGAALAIGNFDGVHRGHQALLQAARDAAAKTGGKAGVMLFEPHPREFFQPDKPHFRLTPLPRKLELLEAFGLDLAVVLRFDAALAGCRPRHSSRRCWCRSCTWRTWWSATTSISARAAPATPRRCGVPAAAHGFGVTVVAQVAEAGEVFSSSAIRAELAQGDVQGAAEMLGHWWRVSGTVIGGAKRGTGLGFPTANIALAPGTALAHGIYAVRVTVDGKSHPAAAYLGTRPTFDDGAPVLEVFLLDFDGDLYGREIAVEFIDHIRGDRRFDGIDELKAQMQHDCDRARILLDRAPPIPRRAQ